MRFDMATGTMPEQGVLCNLFSYDADSGALTRATIGKRADWVMSIGYRAVYVLGKQLYAHRVIWRMIHGDVPEEIDHINGDRADNRLCNLRGVSKAQNALNKRPSRRNSSGATGVHWSGASQKWTAEIQASGVREYLGVFSSKDDAIAARKAAEARLGFHKNHGA
jgi:hypothetical protein